MAKQKIDRRDVLRASGAGLGLLALGRAGAECLVTTPEQTEGPFYPIRPQLDTDPDLTSVQGRDDEAIGQRVIVKGRVLAPDCTPVAGALVEIWQACASGRYNHPADPNPAELDPAFQYWGRMFTNADGDFRFRTIKPGAYPAAPGWLRPPHIHFKITAPGMPTLTTQMYFAGEDLNASDRILQGLASAQRTSVIVDFSRSGANAEPEGNFEIRLGQHPELP